MGLNVDVFRRAGTDCSANGLSARFDSVCVMNVEGPKGFVIGKAPAQQGAYPGFATITEYRPAYIRLNKECADVIFIQRNGDYSGGFVRMPHKAVILNEPA